MKHIPLVEPQIGEEEINAVTEVLRSKWLCQGPKVAEFEQKLAEQLDVEHVICVSSCTAALHLSLIWIRLQQKAWPLNEVIVPDFTFPATANIIRHAGMQPVFVDVDSNTFTLNPDKLNEAITEHTRAIIPVHLFGQPADMLPILEIAEDKKLYIVEDCAGALFTEHENEYVGRFGLTGCFSFTPTKLITTGEGGAITTHDDKLAEWLRLMRSHGRKDVKSIHDLCFSEIGLNYRMTDIQAAIGLEQLKRANEFIEKRNTLANLYSENLPICITPQFVEPYVTQHTYTAYAVLLDASCPPKRYVIDELQKLGIQAHYSSIALHLEPSLHPYAEGKQFPVAEMLSQRTIALPLYPSMTEEDVIYVCNSLTEILQKMRFCPNCDFEDPPCWRSYRWITDMDLTRFEDFQKEYPQWKDLEIGQIVSDKHNFYRRTGKRNGGCFVLRWPKIYGTTYYKSRFFERFKAKRDFPHPHQKRLFEDLEEKNMNPKDSEPRLKMLDIGCGKGGVSDGFYKEGFEVIGIDIVNAPAMLKYPYRFIQADIRDLNGADFKGQDVIWISLPCRDFSKMGHVGRGSIRPNGVLWKWKDPPNPERGLALIKKALKFVEDAQPKFWIMENVPYLEKYLYIKPKLTSKLTRTMKRSFWGNFPIFLMPQQKRGRLKMDIQGKYRSWERAKIPLVCSRAFARACKEALTSQKENYVMVTQQ